MDIRKYFTSGSSTSTPVKDSKDEAKEESTTPVQESLDAADEAST